MTHSQQSNQTKIWVQAMRPRTLPLAIASIIMGSALAAATELFSWPVLILAVLTAVCLQILSNLANDYGDSQHGADHVTRAGPSRAVQSGAISPATMKRAIALFAILSILSGLVLLWFAFGANGIIFFAIFVLLGAAAIGAAITYTAGKNPYGYAGLGDIFVLIFFGWVGVMGTYFLQTQQLDWLILLPASSCGLLAVAVLNVNNIRDIDSDRLAGKNSIPVRIGPRKARTYHWILLALAMVTAVTYVILTYASPWNFLFLLTLPLLWRHGTAVAHTTEPLKLNPLLKQLSLTTLLFVFLFSVGQLI
ncbi:MAG: 1,4-dihydroxy-2-naphthoate polyprenyltransferase [Anaerolineales bacterium]|nr:1,4-dihydroxy-2-naphthoate polyprenyltransferase [Anaerolineales bacterium]